MLHFIHRSFVYCATCLTMKTKKIYSKLESSDLCFAYESQDWSRGFSIVSTGTRHWTDLVADDLPCFMMAAGGAPFVLNRFGFFSSFRMASRDDKEKLSSSSSDLGTMMSAAIGSTGDATISFSNLLVLSGLIASLTEGF